MARYTKTKSGKQSTKTVKKTVKKLTPNTKYFGEGIPQPSPEAKKKGWKKKQYREAILDAFQEYSLMPYKELKQLLDNVRKEVYEDLEGNDLDVRQVKVLKYIINNKLDKDYVDRGVPMMKQEIDLTGNITFNVMNYGNKGNPDSE